MVPARTDQIFEGIVETIREPLLVLDRDLRVVNPFWCWIEISG
jgi:hypothetical protein